MTVKVFSFETRVEAWLASAEYLVTNGDTLNVIPDIKSPEKEGPAGRIASKMLDELYRGENELPMHAVSETIFPAWEYLHRGTRGVYTHYPSEYRILKNASPNRWGTYAGRLIARTDAAGNETNPLKILVEKLRRIHLGGQAKYRAAYELGVWEESTELPIYDNDRDSKRLRGAPCLTHLSFKLIEDDVHLTALYRNHDYRYKVPGNLLGLARLQAFVAHEVDAGIGGLVVHATLGYVEAGRGRAALQKLLRGVAEVVHGKK